MVVNGRKLTMLILCCRTKGVLRCVSFQADGAWPRGNFEESDKQRHKCPGGKLDNSSDHDNADY